MFKQTGIVNLNLPETTLPTQISTSICAGLGATGVSDIEIKDEKISFRGGKTPFKSENKILMPISSGTIWLIKQNGEYKAKYHLELKHLMFWIVAVPIFTVIFLSIEGLSIEKFFTALGISIINILIIYLGNFAMVSTRFPKLLNDSVKHIVHEDQST